MELREYWRTFKRRAWIPILLVIVTAATAGVLAFISKPEYTATAQVTAKSQGTSASGQTAGFAEIATGNDVVAKVIQQLNLNEAADTLANRIKVSSGKTDIYSISITDPNPRHAEQIANAVASAAAVQYTEVNGGIGTTSVFDQQVKDTRSQYAQQFLDAQKALLSFNREHPGAAQSKDINVAAQSAELQLEAEGAAQAYQNFQTSTTNADVAQLSQTNVFQAGVIEQAVAKPDTSSRYFKIGYAGALALILGIGLIFVLEYMDTAIRMPEAAEEMIGAPVVGIIPRANAHTLRPAKVGAA